MNTESDSIIRHIVRQLLIVILLVQGCGTAAQWIDSKRVGSIIYLLADFPDYKICRYDCDADAWLETITLPQAPTAFHVTETKLFVAYAKSVFQYTTSGGNEELVHELPLNIVTLWGDNAFLLAVGSGEGRVEVYGFDSETVHSTTEIDIDAKLSFDTATGALFGYSPYSSSELLRTSRDSTGNVIATDKVFTDECFSLFPTPGSRRSPWIFPDGSMVIDVNGNIIDATTLHYLTTLTDSIIHLDFNDEAIPVVAKKDRIVVFSPDFREKGYIKTGISPIKFHVRGNTAIVIYTDTNTVEGIDARHFALSNPENDPPAVPVDPSILGFTPEETFVADGILYLFDREKQSVFRWNIASQSYLVTIPLSGAPDHVTYAADIGALYCLYAQKKMTILKLDDPQFVEKPFTFLPKLTFGFIWTGNHVIASFSTELISLDTDGRFVACNSASPDRMLNYSVWNTANRSIYTLVSMDLIKETIREDGSFGSLLHSEYRETIYRKNTVRVSPDGNEIILWNGFIYSGDSLVLKDSLQEEMDDAVWVGKTLFTLGPGGLARWEGSPYLRVDTCSLGGVNNCLLATAEGNLVVVYIKESTIPGIEVYDQKFNKVPKQSQHAGETLLLEPRWHPPDAYTVDALGRLLPRSYADISGGSSMVADGIYFRKRTCTASGCSISGQRQLVLKK